MKSFEPFNRAPCGVTYQWPIVVAFILDEVAAVFHYVCRLGQPEQLHFFQLDWTV